jgi:hypothetical protein
MMMSLIEEQLEIIDKLAWHNKHLIKLLSQYMDVEAEEKRLEDALSAELSEELSTEDLTDGHK